MTTSIESKKQL